MKILLKNNDFTWYNVMECRNELFGISIIWIILFHISNHVWFNFVNFNNIFKVIIKVIKIIISKGNIGVDIFLFLSAIGLSNSILYNSKKIFYKHRFNRVVLPYLLIAIPYFIWYDVCFIKDGIIQLTLNITTLNYWLKGDHPTWYVSFIIIMYLVYPCLYLCDKKQNI